MNALFYEQHLMVSQENCNLPKIKSPKPSPGAIILAITLFFFLSSLKTNYFFMQRGLDFFVVLDGGGILPHPDQVLPLRGVHPPVQSVC